MERFLKHCDTCSKEKAFERFNHHKDSIDGFASTCKECQYQASKRHYYKMKSKIDLLKKAPCLDCRKSFNPWQMDFDHLPGHIKLANISKINEFTEQDLLIEINKCDLICSNCHRNRTYFRAHPKLNYYK